MANNIDTRQMLLKGTVIGNYRIDEYIASGGFGNTYKATHTGFDEVVAIKEFFIKGVNHRESDSTTVSVSNSDNHDVFESQLQKFLKEARRLRKMEHPHIVSVRDLFESNGTAYYVMDYVEGESLSARLQRTKKAFSEASVWKVANQVLDALKYVHDKGIFHLDLKPANLMVDNSGNVRLIDFGASKQQSAGGGGATATTGVCYTAGYAPREQMEQNLEAFGPWTDLYALGGTLYCLLTGNKPPLPSQIDADRSPDKRNSLPLPENVSEEMRRLIRTLLRTNYIDRPQSVDEVYKIFNKFGHQPKVEEVVKPMPAPPADRSEKTVLSERPIVGDSDETVHIQPDQAAKAAATPYSYYDETDYDEPSFFERYKWIIVGAAAVALMGLFFLLIPKGSKENQTETLDNATLAEAVGAATSSQETTQEQTSAQTVTEQPAEKKDPQKVEDKVEPKKTEPSQAATPAVKKEEPVKEIPKPKVDNTIYDVAEQQPSFPGGNGALQSWLSQNMQYPAVARENGIQGIVTVSFVVEPSGSLSNVQVVRSPDPSLNNEALRLCKNMKKWSPGKINGQAVRVKYTLPIRFRLQ